jgi:predicted dehydrogenase
MRAGAHAFVEVPMAPTLEEIWSMVDTAEATKRHCMMMENVCYGREELLYLHLCRLEKLGELLHGEAAYIHDLRKQMHEDQRGTGSWRTAHYARRNGNLYPTHGLGPVAQYMSLGRGKDNFARVVSLSSPARGRTLYRDANFPSDHPWHKLEFRGGDLNTSIVQTTQGKTIMVQWDETSPRPYTRHNLIQGTRGILAGFPPRYAIEGEGDTHTWQTTLDSLYQRYEHPLYARVGPLAEKMGGHGGMDFLMLFRIIECLRHGLALDQNVYEGAWWSALGPLSEASVALGGMPQTFPDFSRGLSADTPPLGIV